ncbi:MAG: sugar transferase [Candidatus Pacearchaeota archaeon]|nr:sugar transferase [Candidatus Pacearchaeota archaeon]
MEDRFEKWIYPEIEEGKLTKYNWMVQNKEGLKLGYKTDIGAFTYINAKNGVVIEDFVQIGSHCSLYSVSSIDNKEGQITLKKNCKIGNHSVVMPGITGWALANGRNKLTCPERIKYDVRYVEYWSF